MRPHRLSVAAGVLALAGAAPVRAQAPIALDSAFLAGMEWRSIGPANMMGRVTDVEGIPSPSATFYFAAAAGGIWKSTNGGITYRPVFDDQRVVAMGDLAIAPSDTLQIWAGTGEEDARNSISPGGGIYKSTDGGDTWTLKGLEGTEHIARIVVHPRNPDVVWVAASGPMWRTSEDRGLYKTTDGGDTWRKVKYVSERAGFIDVALDPANPDHLLASSWERMRGPYYLQSGGPGSALWESTDGGESWTEVSGGGFPETELGRIGIAFSPSDPRIIYTLVEAAAPAEGEDRLSGLYRSNDGGETWERMNDTNSRPFYYSQVRVDPVDPDRVYFSSFNFSEDAGKTVRGAAQGVHVDHHAQWIDPGNPNRFITGNDGGIAITFDRGGNYLFPNVVPIGQFYAVSYDMSMPYRVCGGLQDNYSWCGPSRKSNDPITNHDWFSVSGGDGFVTAQDPRDPDIIYSESQGGNIGRMDLATGQRTTLEKPDWRDTYRLWQDSIALIWPDTTVAPAADVQQKVQRFREAATRDSAALVLRWNWNTPFFLSPHDADVLYAGSNRVLKSTQRGDSLKLISPDLSRQDTMKIRVSTQTTGGITPDVTGAETFATIVSLAESPLRRGMLYAGTDDGNLWITTDDGGRWTELTGKLVGLVPDGTYISRIEPSAHVPTRVYVTLDNHRRGDFTPYVLVSEDAGRSFHSIASDLPTGGPDFAHVIREDPVNPDLLYVGTDVGAYVSLDRGGHWQRFMNGLPTVPVHDLKIHPRDHELIAGTHGRSIWIANIAPLQQLRANVLASAAHIFTPTNAQLFGTAPTGGEFTAQLYFQEPTPGSVATLTYWVGGAAQDSGRASLVITNPQGDTVQTLNGPASRGLHSVTWNLRGEAEQLPLSPSEKRDSIATERRLAQVVDSLAAAGTDRAELDRAVEQIRSNQGGFGGFGGGRGGNQNQERGFRERPAEGPAPRGGGGGGGGRGGQGGGGNDLVQSITQAVRGEQGGRGGRRFGGGGLFPRRTAGPAPIAEAGRYGVTLKVGDTTQTTTLTVEHAPSAPTR